MKIILVILISFFPMVSFAQNISGIWQLPNGHKVVIVQESNGYTTVGMALEGEGTGLVRLVFSGVAIKGPGGLGIFAEAQSFPIMWKGRECMVESPVFAAVGNLVGQVGGRRFHAKGTSYIGAAIICNGVSVYDDWGFNLLGVWK